MALYCVLEICKGSTTLEELTCKTGIVQEIRGCLVALTSIDDKYSWRLEIVDKARFGGVSIYSPTQEMSPKIITRKTQFHMEVPSSDWPTYITLNRFKTFQVFASLSIVRPALQ